MKMCIIKLALLLRPVRNQGYDSNMFNKYPPSTAASCAGLWMKKKKMIISLYFSVAPRYIQFLEILEL